MESGLSITAFREGGAVLEARRPDPCAFVLFGATGDLAARKLLPALYDLELSGSLPPNFAILGVSRSAASDDALRTKLTDAVREHARSKPVDESAWSRLCERLHAVAGGFDDAETYARLHGRLEELDQRYGTRGNRLFYLATPASSFPGILTQLAAAELTAQRETPNDATGGGHAWARVVIEKPFGRDLESARELNAHARSLLDESQIFRIDHYLGKETVQNILVFRFGNTIFEPLWNRNHIDHVQVTMAESIGVGSRGRFYEETGVLRDIVQNHLLQVLALCVMEPPVSFEANEIRNMKAQALRGLRPITHDVAQEVVRAQYGGYRSESQVAEGSTTPTFVALRAHIDNWRWQGVPFYLRAGKGLAGRRTEVSFHFKQIPFCLFGDERTCQLVEPNVLTIHVQPDEGISWKIASKIPGDDVRVAGVNMDFRYADAFEEQSPEAYERLILDCMRGDATLFARDDEVELSWRFCDPILRAWDAATDERLPVYPRGSEGPEEARALLRRDGRRWDPIGT